MNRTVINGTPRQNSIKIIDKLLIIGISERLPSANKIPKGREATMEIDTLKGELANCHNNCDLLADDLKVRIWLYLSLYAAPHMYIPHEIHLAPLQLFIRICLSL